MTTADIAAFVAQTLEDNKARDAVVIDIRPQTTMADFLVVCEGDTSRQIRSIVEHLEEACKAHEIGVIRVEGIRDASWVCVDLGDVIVHVLLPGERSFYRIEDLWDITESRITLNR